MATRYISKSDKSQDEVRAWGMEELCTRRSKNRGCRPGITGAAGNDDKWTGVRSPVTIEEKKKVIGKVLEIAVSMIFSHNAFTLYPDPDTRRRQSDGLGFIGGDSQTRNG